MHLEMDRVPQGEDPEREVQINKIETKKSAAVPSKAKKELDIAKFEAEKLTGWSLSCREG